MSWTLAGVVVHVDQQVGTTESLYSRQNVLDATNDTLGFYGAKSEVQTLRFTLMLNTAGDTALDTLIGATVADAGVSLVDDRSVTTTVRILKLSYERVQALNYSKNVYTCSADLVKSVA